MANALVTAGVVSGATVVAQGTPDMTVAVAAGEVIFDRTSVTVTAGNLTVTTADATQDRLDAVVVDSGGTKSIIDGPVNDGANVVASDTTGYVVLAYIYVFNQAHSAYTGTITNAVINTDDAQTPAGVPVPGQIWLSSAGMWPSTTNGCANNTQVETTTNKQNVYTLDFSGTTQEFAECNVMMPSDYDGGTITAYFVFFTVATTGGVVFQLQGRSYADAETLDQSWGTSQKIAKTVTGTANQILITSSTPAITLAGTPAANELALFRVGRAPADTSDTTASDARLLGCMVQFTRQ